VPYTTFAFANSTLIYLTGENKTPQAYIFTFLSSLAGIGLYFLILNSLVIAESTIFPTSQSSTIAKAEYPLLLLVFPFFVSAFTTLAYHFNNNFNPPKEVEDNEIREISFDPFFGIQVNKTAKLKDNDSFYSKIYIGSNSISYNVIKF
jgi:hypothetical protein